MLSFLARFSNCCIVIGVLLVLTGIAVAPRLCFIMAIVYASVGLVATIMHTLIKPAQHTIYEDV